MKSFYVTTPISQEDLTQAIASAKSQEEKILAFFRANIGKAFTPPEVSGAVFYKDNVPITSVRRAMTSLTKAGYLHKKTETRNGLYGKVNHVWMMKK